MKRNAALPFIDKGMARRTEKCPTYCEQFTDLKPFYFLGGNTGGNIRDGVRQLLFCESYDATCGLQI